jgi:hypothetical protein
VTVVGVVGDEKYDGIREPAALEVYSSVTEELTNKWYPPNIVVATGSPPESVISGIRTAVRELDSELSLFRVRTMQQVISDNMQDTSLQTILLGSFYRARIGALSSRHLWCGGLPGHAAHVMKSACVWRSARSRETSFSVAARRAMLVDPLTALRYE